MKRAVSRGACPREVKLTRGVVVQDEGDSFYLVLEAGECDVTFALPDASAKKLCEFLKARLSQRDLAARIDALDRPQ